MVVEQASDIVLVDTGSWDSACDSVCEREREGVSICKGVCVCVCVCQGVYVCATL